jgi:hypothetical protein
MIAARAAWLILAAEALILKSLPGRIEAPLHGDI